eukprot:TRINITY_DN5146_c0_g1_i1.p1 TRINITY_DN5146_c0_g1~~TRINITY_DN5146_c0_g1_i1.p1  ORF type:complete len:152 (-),score=52.03 TRINITY_DN5146_c0_g1_i1:162-617(-)
MMRADEMSRFLEKQEQQGEGERKKEVVSESTSSSSSSGASGNDEMMLDEFDFGDPSTPFSSSSSMTTQNTTPPLDMGFALDDDFEFEPNVMQNVLQNVMPMQVMDVAPEWDFEQGGSKMLITGSGFDGNGKKVRYKDRKRWNVCAHHHRSG